MFFIGKAMILCALLLFAEWNFEAVVSLSFNFSRGRMKAHRERKIGRKTVNFIHYDHGTSGE